MGGRWGALALGIALGGSLAALVSPDLGRAESGAAESAGVVESLPDTVDRVRPAVVGVCTRLITRRPPSILRGTGFVVGDGRHVVTNAHVLPSPVDLERNEILGILFGRGKEGSFRRARVLAEDPEHDLAVLGIEGEPLPALTIGSSKAVREGELYAFTGFPIGTVLGLYPATHRGLIAAVTPIAVPMPRAEDLSGTHVMRLKDPYDVFQLDATAYPGNSGSPLYDPRTGQVVGVINRVLVKETRESILEHPSGISYAIPIDFVVPLLERAKQR